MRTQIAFALLFVLQGGVAAQSDVKTTIQRMYTKTLDEMQTATTPGEIERIVNAIDAPDWLSINPDGTRLTREEAKQELVRSLAGPRGAQPSIDLLWFNQASTSATAVAWVFGKSLTVDTNGEFG